MNTLSLLFIGSLGAPEIIIIALVVLLLFGGKKIPELMRGIGKGVRSFKEGINGIEKDIKDNTDVEANAKSDVEKN
jgi:sec-independent protein translocase protein TatA